jgi:LysM repeat protein/ABC-type branched-subunit amino acid transport system substrate-binding protein
MTPFAQVNQIQISERIEKAQGKTWYIHEVSKGQTLYSIAKAYKVPVSEIHSANPGSADGIRNGQELRIPLITGLNATPAEMACADFFRFHHIEPGNTLFSLSREYKIPVDSINFWNPWIENGIAPGVWVRFPKAGVNQDWLIEKLGLKAGTEPPAAGTGNMITHTVAKGETLYAISRKYKVSVDKLMELNPETKSGLSIGQKLKIPSLGVLDPQIVKTPDPKAKEREIPKDQQKPAGKTEHVVKSGETLFGIAGKYGVTVKDLTIANQLGENPLKPGMVLVIPKEPVVQEDQVNLPSPSGKFEDEKYYYHKVVPGESLFSISKFYHIKEKKIIRTNGKLAEKEVQPGEEVLIPKKEIRDIQVVARRVKELQKEVHAGMTPVKEPEPPAEREKPCSRYKYSPKDTLYVSLMLPFFLTENDSIAADTLKRRRLHPREYPRTDEQLDENIDQIPVYQRSRAFIEFYEGFLLSMRQLEQQGIHIRLFVYDTGRNEEKVKSILQKPELKRMNLIVGPVYPQSLAMVSAFAKEHHINIVSPLTSAGRKMVEENPYLFQVIPPVEVQVEELSKVMSDYFHKNIIILHFGNEKELEIAELFKKYLTPELKKAAGNQKIKLREFHATKEKLFDLSTPVTDGGQDAEYMNSPLRGILDENSPNLIILASRDRSMISNVFRQLNTIYEGSKGKIDINLCGFPDALKFDNIETDYFFNLEYHTFQTFHIDYSREDVKLFISDYREHYFNEPSQFSFQGYDVGALFVSGLARYGNDFSQCLGEMQRKGEFNGLQNEMKFSRVGANGGFENKQVFVVMYDHDYDMVRLDKLFHAAPADPQENKSGTEKKEDSLRLYRGPL